MYAEYGGAPAAGVVTASASIAGRRHMIIANDATVKAGAFFPATAKKVLRAQRIAFQNRLPLIYLVDSAGVFLPLQEDVFPDEDDFGRIFRNNAVISAAGIGQIAAIMGNCVAGGGYLPVLCDKLLMTEGSGLYLAGPALVKSAIGQEVSSEDLGGAAMHAQISGTIDYREPDDDACLARLRRLVGARLRPTPPQPAAAVRASRSASPPRGRATISTTSSAPTRGATTKFATCSQCIVDRRQLRRIQGRVRQDARLRHGPHRRLSGRHRRQPASSREAGRRADSSSAACSMSTAPRRPRGS